MGKNLESKTEKLKWDILMTTVFSVILATALFFLEFMADTIIKHILLIFKLTFFMVLMAILIRSSTVVPIIFLIVAIITRNTLLFAVNGVSLIFFFSILGAIFLLLFNFLRPIIKVFTIRLVFCVIVVMSVKPFILLFLLASLLERHWLYAFANIAIINFLVSVVAAFIAVIIWHRGRVFKFFIKLGY